MAFLRFTSSYSWFIGAPGIAIWIRRYMIDLQSQDFVRFARAKGLSEKKFQTNTSLKMPWFRWFQEFLVLLSGVIGGATLD